MSTTSPQFVARTWFHSPNQSSRVSFSSTISRSSRGVSANRGALAGDPTTVKRACGMAPTRYASTPHDSSASCAPASAI